MICSPFDIVEVPFPFSDVPRSKRRKALALSDAVFNQKNASSLLMMITSTTMCPLSSGTKQACENPVSPGFPLRRSSTPIPTSPCVPSALRQLGRTCSNLL